MSLMLRAAYGGWMDQLRQRTAGLPWEVFEPVLRQILLDGMEELFYIAHPDSAARLLIMLAMDVTDRVAFMLAQGKAASRTWGG